MTIKYEKTANTNVVKKIETIESEILVDKLELEINNLTSDITSISEILQYPADTTDKIKEAIDFFNKDINLTKDHLEIELLEKQELLTKVNNATEVGKS